MPLIFFGSNGIGFTSKLFGLGAAAGCAGAARAGVCARASPAPIAAATAAPAVNADPACTKLRRSSSVVIVSLHTDVHQSSGVIEIISKCVTLSALVHSAILPGLAKVSSSAV